mgnify:CR=1 FL=1
MNSGGCEEGYCSLVVSMAAGDGRTADARPLAREPEPPED